ncbi:MAG: RluA family pseudouridine synthase [Mycoplasmataceae bacterium]|jgi:23S rRNA pseudouridine955/2504/2580 synthase|nr:RluA family pseudouridine synthase [Mycoplasmataceae bacterium]
MQELIINKNDINKRLDNFLKKVLPKISLSGIFKAIRNNRIKVNDKKITFNYKLNLNDKVQIYLNDDLLLKASNSEDFLKVSKNLDIVYEDENILIVNKPIGLVVQDDETHTIDTLNNRIKHNLFNKGEWEYKNEYSFAPSLVHRLDKNTSGLIMAAKNAESLNILNQKIKQHQIDKYYLCEVYGIMQPKNGVLNDYLTKDANNKIVKVSKKPLNLHSQQIITEYRTISHDNKSSLLEVKLVTGKTHQIRAHMDFVGHPLVGEKKYTTKEYSRYLPKSFQRLKAYKIVFNFKTDAGVLNYLKNKIIKL